MSSGSVHAVGERGSRSLRFRRSSLRTVEDDAPRAPTLEGDPRPEVVREHLPHRDRVDEVHLRQVLGGHAVAAGDVRLDSRKVHDHIVGLSHVQISYRIWYG